MRSREGEIIEAARAVFTRYGYRKASMQDIAESAHVSRPTLYAVFPDKAAVFTALVRQVTEENTERCARQLSRATGVSRRVRIVMDVWIVNAYVAYAAYQAHPGADDIVAIAAEVAPAAMTDFWDACSDQIVDALSPLAARRHAGFARDLAFTLMSAARDAKAHATSESSLRSAIDRMIAVVETLSADTGDSRRARRS